MEGPAGSSWAALNRPCRTRSRLQRHLRLARYIPKQDRVQMSIDQSYKNRPAARDASCVQSTDGVTTEPQLLNITKKLVLLGHWQGNYVLQTRLYYIR